MLSGCPWAGEASETGWDSGVFQRLFPELNLHKDQPKLSPKTYHLAVVQEGDLVET